MKEFDEDFLEKIKKIIEAHDEAAARRELEEMHPADIAELYQDLDLSQAEYLYRLLDGDKAADVLMELDEDDRRKLLSDMDPEEIARLYIDHLDTDDAVDLIQDLDKEDRDEVLSHIDECIKQLRMQAEDMDEVYYVYVVDNDDRLRGTLPLKKLITHPSVSKIKNVMETDPVAVKTDMPLDEVAIDFEKYDLVAMPVVDSIGRLVGHITVDDVMDRVRESSERDYQLASGLSQDVESDDTIWQQTRARLPWLLIGILGGIGNSLILGNFEQGFATNPAMALFIPMIGGTGGNVGIQSSAIVVQGLANGSLDLKDTGKQLFKEVGVGVVNGLIISLIVFLYNVFSLSPWNPTTLAVSLSLMAVVLFASIFGTFVPLTLERFKIDPALATGPFISITNDIIGMLIYMLISAALMNAFA